MFEEDAIATANGGFSITEHIPSKSNSRSRIEQVSLRAPGRRNRTDCCSRERRQRAWRGYVKNTTGTAANHQTIQRIANARNQSACASGYRTIYVDLRCARCVEQRRIPIVCMVVTLPVCSFKAHTQTQV